MQPSSYRPISLLPIPGKVFEALIINKTLVQFLERHELLSDMQYGFRHSRSTGDLSYAMDHISRVLDRQGETRSVALDISEAFDKVWHQGLLTKLRSYGISGQLNKLVASFLEDRQMSTVVLNGQRSSTKCINAGVPQGSILGPTLFLL